MNEYVKIAALHLMLLAVQAVCMYISSKRQMLNRLFLYALGVPVAMAIPLLIYKQDPHAYNLYEYAATFLMIEAFLIDTIYAALTNKDYMTVTRVRGFNYSFFWICLIIAFSGETGVLIKAAAASLLIGTFSVNRYLRKSRLADLVIAAAFALIPLAGAWLFVNYVFGK